MDGFNTGDGVIIVATTNRRDILDPAILRPGRFDRKVTVPLPDINGRNALFEYYINTKPYDKNINLKEISLLCEGFSGADIKNLVNEAAILSVRNDVSQIDQSCMYYALEKIIIGLPKDIDSRDEITKTIVAYHEAGHAFMAHTYKKYFKLNLVTINSNLGGAGGYTLFTTREEYLQLPTVEYFEARISVALAGRIIENLLNKDYEDKFEVTSGASQDLVEANRLAKLMVEELGFGKLTGLTIVEDNNSDNKLRYIEDDVNEILTECAYKTTKHIECNFPNIQRFVDVLLKQKTVFKNEIDKIYSQSYT